MTDNSLIGQVHAPGLHIMTWNIRRPMPNVRPGSPDRWSRRRPLVRRLLETERPTLLGVQEAVGGQLDIIAESLGPEFAWVGRGREVDGTGEHCAIFHDTTRLRVVEWAQLALSDSPQIAGSRSWGNLVPRVVVRATIEDLSTGTTFIAMNTHLDHLSRRSRIRSAQFIGELRRAATLPVIVMGDANTPAGSAPYRLLTDGAGLRDSWPTADRRLTQEWGTFSHYRPPKDGGRRIDWILVSSDIDVAAAGINVARFEGAAASDHEPMQAILRFVNEETSQRARA